MHLLLIRHGESIGNQQGRMEGQSSTPLSAKGKYQTDCLAHALFAHSWRPTHVYSSPLTRAIQTTERLLAPFDALKNFYALKKESENEPAGAANAPHPTKGPEKLEAPAFEPRTNTRITLPATPLTDRLPVTYTPDLQELHPGIFQGLTWPQAQSRYPDLCAALESSPEWLPIPGAESLQDARDRATQFIQTLFQHHGNGDRLWVVTHEGLLLHLLAVLLGSDRTWGLSIGHTACFEFWIDRTRWMATDENRWNPTLWQIRRFNDQQHLSGNALIQKNKVGTPCTVGYFNKTSNKTPSE